jgi:outer membrane protein TolC
MSSLRFFVALFLFWMCGAWLAPPAEAAAVPSAQRLPEPLTLEAALSLADQSYPDVAQAQAALDQARADRDAVKAGNSIQASIEGRLRWVEPSPVAPNQTHNDNHVGLYITKRLYDFGRTKSRLGAARDEVDSQQLLYADARAQHRLDVMGAYFDVLLADLMYARDNEAMAVAYVSFDRMRDRRKQGEVSDIDVLKAEQEYQQARRKRYASDVRRRASRSRLANLLNRPGMLPSTLVKPDLPDLKRKLPDVEQLERQALDHNPALKSLRARIKAAQQRVQAARAGNYPVIDGELETSAYNRELGSTDRVRAGILFRMPLFTGGAVSAAVARQQAALRQVRAELARKEMDVRQAVLEAWQHVYVLHAQQDAARVNADYRDLYLDRSRALYELDVNTDLGDSMVEYTAAQLYNARTRYQLALTLARLNALTGKPVWSPPKAGGGKP